MRMLAAPFFLPFVEVIRACIKVNGKGIGVLEDQLAVGNLKSSPLVANERLGFVVEGKGVLLLGLRDLVEIIADVAFDAQGVPARAHLPLVHVRHPDRAGERSRLVGHESEYNHPRRMACEIFTPIFHPTPFVGDRVNRPFDVQLAPVLGRVRSAVEVDEKITECLVIPGVILVSSPEGVLVELEAFVFNAAEDHRAHAAVADWQGLQRPLMRGDIIPEL